MKVLYSSIKELVPDLTATAREVADVLTLIGYMADKFEEVTYKGVPDALISLEVRQNRADCFSVYGIARETAAYYGLSYVAPAYSLPSGSGQSLGITIADQKSVRRVLAARFNGITQGETPSWMVEFLSLYGMNSINVLVDISNYVMIMSGYPSHCIDADAIAGNLSWNTNTRFDGITTLDGSEYELSKDGRYLLISDDTAPIALAGIVGAQYGSISPNTTSIIAEMAVYDAAVVRDNMRSLHILTEAGNRLGKDLDPAGAGDAFALLCSLLTEYAGATISSEVFEYYPVPSQAKTISFDPAMSSAIAGITISPERGKDILQQLSFEVIEQGDVWQVTVPTCRTDVEQAEDLAEEVIRMVGYDQIPSDELPALSATVDITPTHVAWADILNELLSARGYDEVRSLPLVSSSLNAQVRYNDFQPITTQNTVNEEFPELRQSLITGMLLQKEQYEKRNVMPMRVFEYGKVFWKNGTEYQEGNRISMCHLPVAKEGSLAAIYQDASAILARMGLATRLVPSGRVPACANPYACYDIVISDQSVGICFLLDDPTRPHTALAEIDVQKALAIVSPEHRDVVELTEKLVSLDTNIELSGDEALGQYLKDTSEKVGRNAWSVEVVDRYPLDKKVRYTVRVTYQGLSDTDAKALHTQIFAVS